MKLNNSVWNQVETTFCTSGKSPGSEDPSLAVYSARIRDFDHLRAKALCLIHEDVDVLQRARTLIATGDHGEALAILESENLADSESLLEKSRIACFQGDWPHAIGLCNQALSSAPTSITRMTLLQVRSLAFFEIGEFSKCLADTRNVLTLEHLYPHTSLGVYAQILQIKATARSLKDCPSTTQLWKTLLQQGKLNADVLIALCRMEVDLARLRGEEHLTWIEAYRLLSQETGERHYQTLAKLDKLLHFTRDVQVLSSQVSEEAETNEQVRKILSEIESRTTSSTTTATIEKAKVHPAQKTEEKRDRVTTIVFLKHEILVNLRPFKATPLPPGRMGAALRAFSQADQLEYVDFFRLVWGEQKFVPRLHLNSIHKLASRIRRDCLVDVSCSGVLNLKSSLTVP